ncbi:peptide chain release factor N(5)-glutamine methyltransferase [Tepidimonas taiwanensis]|uniref:peptide chain release factor N(5)-glutamine methyltransferase n=1 Tax=Tepidimonas taiwanensis TaxID=307486 RepID=UPI0006898913|nr:peptide chain release factor N(5)-glutamine methyltransferase [Tepidimonas taiwanensis]
MAGNASALDAIGTAARIADAVRAAQAAGLERLDAQWLLLHALGRPLERAWLLAHGDEPLARDAAQRYAALCRQRLDGVPLAYLIGERGFHGLLLRVDARVLDPRPDTETLVDWALERLPPDAPASVLDLGTGSGAIALAIQHARPAARVWGLDMSADALAVAADNGRRLGLPVRWLRGRWWNDWTPYPDAPLPGPATPQRDADPTDPAAPVDPAGHTPLWPARFDLVVANPPYLRADDPHLAALRHEPRHALVGGPDGLDDLRAIATGAPSRLAPGGWLLLEHGWDQADAVSALLRHLGYADVEHRRDLGGHRRCTGGRWPGSAPTGAPPTRA